MASQRKAFEIEIAGTAAAQTSTAPAQTSVGRDAEPAAQSSSPDPSAQLLGTLLEQPRARSTAAEPLSLPSAQAGLLVLAEIVATQNPSLPGRVKARWAESDGQVREDWLAVVMGLAARIGDRVLLARPENSPEPIVMAVVNGASARPQVALEPAGSIALRAGESIRITSSDGTPLFEAFEKDGSPVLRLAHPDLALELAGELKVRAGSIDMRAESGEARLEATDEVVIRGEKVQLN